MSTTEALVLQEIGGSFELGKIQVAEPNADEALIEIVATGICHTDISCANGTLPASAPAVFGHEGGGIVKKVGSNVNHVKPGDKVLLSFFHCQECEPCKDGHPAYCYQFMGGNFGGKRLDGSCAYQQDGKDLYSHFFGQTSWSRLTVAHKSTIVKVSDDADLALYSPLGCGLQTGAGSVLNTLNVQKGQSIVVFGAGSVGMSAIMAAKIREANPIIAVDLQESRLELAKKLGATHTILGGDVVAQIKELCPPTGVKFAVDCTGVPAVVENMIECLGTRGKAATVGAPAPGKKAGADILNHLVLGKEYVGCCEGDAVPSEFVPYLMKLHKEGRYPIDELIKVYDVKDFEKALKDMHDGTTLKAVLKW